MKSRTCLVGLGNILMQDDGVGVHAAKEIERRYRFTPEIDIVDGGTLGLALLPLIEGYPRVLFIDAVEAGLEPGAIIIREGEELPAFFGWQVSVHQAGLADLLYAARMAGVMPPETCLVGIQPQAIALSLETTALLEDRREELIGRVLARLEAWGIRADFIHKEAEMYKKCLVPLDGSELAECSLNHVKTLVKEKSVGEVTILNIVKVDIPWAEVNERTIDLEAIRKSLFAAARKYLADVETRLASEGISVKTEAIEANRPGETIVDYARQKGMGLIVISTHGYTGFKKLLLGSVATGVLNESPVPVLLIRPESCHL